MPTDDGLIRASAVELVERLRREDVSPLELLDALESRIGEVDGEVNALPTLCFDRARDNARALMARPVSERGLLAGMPVPIKDLTAVAGVRTTFGCAAFADNVPESSDQMVELLERNGAVVYAKSNTPEFGAGGNTFNDVLGTTRNPWDLERSAAGSSGGAAAALATGCAWVAQGSDMGGSLRNPASFCGVVGVRPAQGRIGSGPGALPFQTLATSGPMARTVEDAALLFDAMCGELSAAPLSRPAPAGSFLDAARGREKPRRVAFSPDLGGLTPVEPEVARHCEAAARRLESLGIPVDDACPDLGEAPDIFLTLRAIEFKTLLGALMEQQPGLLKPDLEWNIRCADALTADDVVRVQRARATVFNRVLEFFGKYDLLLCPATISTAYPLTSHYLETCNGHRFEHYMEWLTIAYAITVTSCPSMSIPCALSDAGLPVGLQVVGPPNGDARMLAGAALLEDLIELPRRAPIEPAAG